MTEEKKSTPPEETILTEAQKAFNTIAHVCKSYQGTLQDHQAIQKALALLKPMEE